MTETEASIAGTSAAGGDTEIDLYADVVENELETVRNRSPLASYTLVLCLQETGDDYAGQADHAGHDGDLYDDVITTQTSGTDFTDITDPVNRNIGKHDHVNESITGGNTPSNHYNGKRVSLYVGQLTWVCARDVEEGRSRAFATVLVDY